jgi:hypothetical protein
VEIEDKRYIELMSGQQAGKVITHNEFGFPILEDRIIHMEEVVSSERIWRDSELFRADLELYKVQDSDPKSTGSVTDWRNYRKLLRVWPENKDFPNKEFRPKAPDA